MRRVLLKSQYTTIEKKLFLAAGVLCLILFTLLLVLDRPSVTTEPSEPKNEQSAVATKWIGAILILTADTPGYSPPVAARAFGYIGLGFYESVRFSDPTYQTLAGQVNGFDQTLLEGLYNSSKTYSWDLVANAYFGSIVEEFYKDAPRDSLSYAKGLESYLYSRLGSDVDSETLVRSVALGQAIAERIAVYARSDGQAEAHKNNFPKDYTPPSGDGLWKQTPPAYQAALQPYWGDARPFILENREPGLLLAPPEYSTEASSVFFAEALEARDAVVNITDEQRKIAQFWSDDPGKTPTPPGHSLSILKQVIERENVPLVEAGRAFAMLGIGLHDSFVACWRAKYAENVVRPITYIQEHIDPTFSPILPTPPFPEYPSGHSVQSAAAATILTNLFGSGYAFDDQTHASRVDIDGSPRHFESFEAFAEEAAISRLFGGIHYRSAIENGLSQGKMIGENVNELLFIQ